jgi:hypothetical protein
MGKHSIKKREKASSPSPSERRLRAAASQATSATRRTGKVGAVAGGLLGLTFLPLAVAHADDWTVTADPESTELFTGIYGHGFEGGDTAPPAVEGSIQGNQIFDWTNVTTSNTGQFFGFGSYSNDGLGGINTEVYVASVPADGPYADADYSGTPSVGSVFDTYSYGYGLYTNTYSAIPNGDGTATITDTLQTPTGTVVIPTAFDAAEGLIADAGGVGTGNGGSMIPVGSMDVTSISGIPPLTVALQGSQDFSFLNSAGTSIGTVGTVDTTTTDGAGVYTEAVLVADDNGLTNIGTSAANVPAEGSIFNTINFNGLVNVYSDYVSAGGNQYQDTLYTPLGNYVIPITFDAAKVEDLSNVSITLPNGMTFDPTTELGFTGINGLPPVDVGVQGGQNFDFTDGASTGSFTADVTNTLDEFNDSTETILVTSSTDAALLPQGSEFEIVNLGYGYESVYSDIASATPNGDTIMETLVTPFGDISMPPSFDAAAGLINDMFSIFAGGAALS